MAGVPAHMFPSTPPTADPGSSKRVQLHRGRGVYRGARHAWPASHVPDPQSQQGTTLSVSPAKSRWDQTLHFDLYL